MLNKKDTSSRGI